MSRPILKRWENVSGRILAEAIVSIVEGNMPQLLESPEPPDSVWGKIVISMGIRYRSLLDRNWAFTAWNNNQKNVQDIFREICKDRKIIIYEASRNVAISHEKIPVYCICKRPELDDPSSSMIACDECDEWFHGLCVNSDVNKFTKSAKWTCPRCRHDKTVTWVPRIFRNSFSDHSIYLSAQSSRNMSKSASDAKEYDSPCSDISDPKFTSTPNKSKISQKKKKETNVIVTDESFESEIQADVELDFNSDIRGFGALKETDGSKDGEPDVLTTEEEPEDNDEEVERSHNQSSVFEQIEGPIKDHNQFNCILRKEEWNKIIPIKASGVKKDKRYQWRLPKGVWTHIFNDAFLRKCTIAMKGCVLAFHDHRVVKSESSIFLFTQASCNRACGKCTMKYNFIIDKEPTKKQDVILHVNPSGTLQHDLTIIDKRQLAGIKRKESKEVLKTTKASVYRRKLYGSEQTDKIALEKGNLTQVQTLDVLKKARKEALAVDDYHSDILLDLVIRREKMQELSHLKGNSVNGFIQEFSCFPFYVSLYTEKQFTILKKLLQKNKGTVLHLDSTGSMNAKLPEVYGKKRQFYYAIVVRLPEGVEAPCIPVFEFVLNNHSAVTISHILHWFFTRFGDYTGQTSRGFGIMRVETDCSRALISAVLQSLEIGPVHIYLKDAWRSLNSREPIYFVHHICRSHTIKFVSDSIKFHFKGRDDTIKILTSWLYQYLSSKDLWDFTRRIEDVVWICGQRFLFDEINNFIINLRCSTSREGTIPWISVDLNNLPASGPFYGMSPFSHFAIMRCKLLKIRISDRILATVGGRIPGNDSDADDEAIQQGFIRNPHHNIEFIQYLIRNVFPFGCMMDHSLFILNNLTTNEDTNATSESWNKIIKEDELKWDLPMKIGRLISRLEENLRGRLTQFDMSLLRLTRVSKTGREKKRTEQEKEEDDEAEDFSQETDYGEGDSFKGQENLSQDREDSSQSRGGLSQGRGSSSQGRGSSSQGRGSSSQGRGSSSQGRGSSSQGRGGSSQGRGSSGLDQASSFLAVERKNQYDRSINPERGEEQWRNSKAKAPSSGAEKTPLHSLSRIPYGGSISLGGRSIQLRNSCNIDNVLQILYSLFRTHDASNTYLKHLQANQTPKIDLLISIFQSLDESSWAWARRNTLVYVMEIEPLTLERGDLFESEDKFLKSIAHIFCLVQHREHQSNIKCNIPATQTLCPMKDIVIRSPSIVPSLFNNIEVEPICSGTCRSKDVKVWYEWSINGSPPFFAYPIAQGFDEVQEVEIPKKTTILNANYELFAYTVYSSGHYKSVLIWNDKKFIYDGLRSESLQPFVPANVGHRVSTVWLKRV